MEKRSGEIVFLLPVFLWHGSGLTLRISGTSRLKARKKPGQNKGVTVCHKGKADQKHEDFCLGNYDTGQNKEGLDPQKRQSSLRV